MRDKRRRRAIRRTVSSSHRDGSRDMSRSRDAHASRDALAATFAGVTGADVAFAARAIEVRVRARARATPMGWKRGNGRA